jgi:glycosyltransferase involved in cell wall biosynthesis
MKIAMVGTRGVPARYGGFETAIEEIGQRLVERGHVVTVYCRRADGAAGAAVSDEHLGMRLVHLPALRTKTLETITHSALSAMHAAVQRGTHDAVFVFNGANSPYIPFFRARGMPVAVHVDGLEWRRAKWGGGGRRYYRAAEVLTVRWADALIADAAGIAAYYQDEFGASTERIAYGAPILYDIGHDKLAPYDLVPGGFHLVVARFEPENHVDLIVRGMRASDAQLPIVVVGTAPYADEHVREIRAEADQDSRIRLIGSVWDQDLLNQLYANCASYVHGHSIGGTNPSLLRAMGAGAPAIALDVRFNREVLGPAGVFFSDERSLATALTTIERHTERSRRLGRSLQQRAADHYRWDDVATKYEELAVRLAAGFSRRGETSGRRAHADHWQYDKVLTPVGGSGSDGSLPELPKLADDEALQSSPQAATSAAGDSAE